MEKVPEAQFWKKEIGVEVPGPARRCGAWELVLNESRLSAEINEKVL